MTTRGGRGRQRQQSGTVSRQQYLAMCREQRDARRQRYLDALRDFSRQHGRAPTAQECGAGYKPCRRPSLPQFSSLQLHFGSFNRAILAAGLTPRTQGDRVEPTTEYNMATRTVTTRCACGAKFTAPTRHRRDCADCKRRKHEQKLAAKRRDRPGCRHRHVARQAEVAFRSDFLLALPEMRRELARVCQTGTRMRQDIYGEPADELPGRRRSA